MTSLNDEQIVNLAHGKFCQLVSWIETFAPETGVKIASIMAGELSSLACTIGEILAGKNADQTVLETIDELRRHVDQRFECEVMLEEARKAQANENQS